MIVGRDVRRLIDARCRIGLRIAAVRVVGIGLVGIIAARIVDLCVVGSYVGVAGCGAIRGVGGSGRGRRDAVAGFRS